MMINVHDLLQKLKEMGEERSHSLLRDLLIDNIVQNFDDASILTETYYWRRHLVLQGIYLQDIDSLVSLARAIISNHEESLYEQEVMLHVLESIDEEEADEEY